MHGETKELILPGLRSAQYLRACKERIPISMNYQL